MPRASLRRLAQAHRLLEQRRAVVDRLRQLTDRLERARLFPTAGDRWLLDRLDARLAAAEAAFDKIVAGASRGAAAVARIERPLQTVEWTVAAESRSRAEAQLVEQDAAVRMLTEDLGTIRLWFDRYRRELGAAMAVGALVTEEDQALLTEVDGRIQLADQDAAGGRYDTVAAAVSTTRRTLQRLRLWESDSFEERINAITAERVAAERHEATMSLRTELFLIAAPHAAPGPAACNRRLPLEYRVLLRRPSFEASQETNLHDTTQIEIEDRRRFRETIDEVAKAASGGVRSAVGTPVEPVRGIRTQPR
ncbi:MAG: hypothetical protein H0V92_12945 [Pseudonocardiales bacterium]|nr:hypothetical protein [Pseudonocardiales bacterium]